MNKRSILLFLSQGLIVLAAMLLVPESGWQQDLTLHSSNEVSLNQDANHGLFGENLIASHIASSGFTKASKLHFFEGPVFEIIEECEFNEGREKEDGFQKHLETLQYYSSLFFQKSLGACLSFLQKQTPELKSLIHLTFQFYLVFQVFRI